MRESGTTGPGVAEVMQAAGLTHGGFYKHFGSRDDLVAEAVGKAFADANAGFDALTDGAEDPLAAFVDWYASAARTPPRAARWWPSAPTSRAATIASAPPTASRSSATWPSSKSFSALGRRQSSRSARWSGPCSWHVRSTISGCRRRSCRASARP
ncbi:MAG: TetR/AcrR family transcriptional regulator [Actinobacteria bacterium]|nr:MAG: TetR/AcrR family transcriptional regulator [Actinomycetota bacterium]